MATLASALLLTAVTMVQADQMSDVLKLPPHKHHVYIFDVTSEASVKDLKAALRNFTVEGSYKVISNEALSLQALTFPAGSEVTQHPVEHVREYLKMFDAEKKMEGYHSEPTLPDTTLLLFERQHIFPDTMCPETFATEMRAWVRQYLPVFHAVKFRAYPLIASYPPRMLIFAKLGDNTMQNFARLAIPSFGGFGRLWLHLVKRIVLI